MKRSLSVMLALVLALSLAVPAFAMVPPAEEPADMEGALAAVTSAVKGILDVDDGYTDFSGSYNDGLTPGWSLHWSDDDRELSVTCRLDGVVTEVYTWDQAAGRDRFYGFDAAFPTLAEKTARTQAEKRLGRLMGEGESFRVDDCEVSLGTDAAYRFSGRILKNGLESPVTFNIRMDANGLAGYSRSDSYVAYVGDVPAAKPSAREADAAGSLAAAAALELYYVSGDDGAARLQYVPVGPRTVVDARSGETVDMDALYEAVRTGGDGAEVPAMESAAAMAYDSAAGDAGGRALTEVELSSIENYRGAMTQDALDGALRAVAQLGLTGFDLSRCSYSMDDDGAITASLRYTAEMTADRLFGFSKSAYEDYMTWNDTATVYKYFTVDAKTGALRSVSTSYPIWDAPRTGGTDQKARNAAEKFLSACAGDMFAETALCTLKGYDGREELTYARTHEGYFFPENYLRVEMDPTENTVDSFSYEWDADITFAAAKDIITEVAAQAAYTGALTVTLGYVAWPETVVYDDPAFARYIDWGYSWVESLRLAYYYSGTDTVRGVDALTGEPVRRASAGDIVYSDLTGDAESIEALARAGIGFAGGEFRADAALTRRDAVTLLLQAAGYGTGWDITDWDDSRLFDEARYYGFVTAESWAPDETVTRIEFIRMVIGASRYGDTAALAGIWAEAFSDVSAADMGYAAVAKALGMASGDTLEPQGICTRGDGAEMLFRFMSR